jgi:hypothetical protein
MFKNFEAHKSGACAAAPDVYAREDELARHEDADDSIKGGCA